MKISILIFVAVFVFAQCPNPNSSKDLELKEKELALKEKELELKAKEKESEDDKKKEAAKEVKKEKPAEPAPKKKEPSKKKKPTGTKGCGLRNQVVFKKGTSAQTFKCDLATNSGNTKHRYLLKAEAGQDLTISFTPTGASYDVTAPKGGGRVNGVTSAREVVKLNEDGTWTISVNLDGSASFGSYTINFEIK